jgi:hypothetical protein
MRILIDPQAARRLALRTATDEYRDHRRYYTAAAPIRAIVVCRNGLELHDLAGQVVDAQVGHDLGWRDFVRPGNEDHLHSKVTVYRRLPFTQPQRTLSDLLAQAPRDEGDA